MDIRDAVDETEEESQRNGEDADDQAGGVVRNKDGEPRTLA